VKNKIQKKEDIKNLKQLTTNDLLKIKDFNKENIENCKLVPIKIYFWSIEKNKIKFEKHIYTLK